MPPKEFIFNHQFNSLDQALDFLFRIRSKLTETSHIRLENKRLTVKSSRDLNLNVYLNESARYDTLELYCDGGSRGNPGPGAAGFLIFDISSSDKKRCLSRGGKYFEFCTNNYAECQSLNLGLKAVLDNFQVKKSLKIYMDSQLIVKQIQKDYKIKNPDLKVLHQQIQSSLDVLPDYKIFHVPRILNRDADAIVNQILDQKKDFTYK